MKTKNLAAKLLLTALFSCNIAVHAESRIIKPSTEVTKIEVDGMTIALINTRIDLNNAHPVEYVGFFRPKNGGAGEQIGFESDGEYIPYLTLKRGADCAVTGVRILSIGSKLKVVYASRKGEWKDRRNVSFVVYELSKNDDGMPGVPPLYFQQVKKVNSKAIYCDVNDALNSEHQIYK